MANIKRQKGFSLVETVIYIGLMSAILLSLIYIISSASGTYYLLRNSRNIERSAINIMDTFNVQTDTATKIDLNNTKFDSATGSIALISYDDVGNSTTTKIYLSGNNLMLSQNNNVLGPINLSDVRVTKFVVRNFSTSTINGFKIEMNIDNASSSVQYMSENFYNSYILR